MQTQQQRIFIHQLQLQAVRRRASNSQPCPPAGAPEATGGAALPFLLPDGRLEAGRTVSALAGSQASPLPEQMRGEPGKRV